jgi:hypothetical protein
MAASQIADELVRRVIQSLLEGMSPELARHVKSQKAAKEYALRVRNRRLLIQSWSEALVDEMVRDVAREVAEKALLREIGRRDRARRSGRHWHDLAEDMEEHREAAAKEREGLWEGVRRMGLGGSVYGSEMMTDLDPTSPLVSRLERLPADEGRLDEFAFDQSLHRVVRAKNDFHAPSTFLHSIARASARLLPPAHEGEGEEMALETRQVERKFDVVLSRPSEPASTPGRQAGEWLKSKLSHGDGDRYLSAAGGEYGLEVVGRYDEAGLECAGMVLFEAPLRGADAEQEAM